MIKQTLFVPLAGCLLAMACAQANAAPNPYSNFVVFGDSLSDAGTFTDTDGPAGSGKRFTNRTGPNYQDGSGEFYSLNATQLLGGRLGFTPDQTAASSSTVRPEQGLPDGNNWAVGGYRTDQILDSITSQSATGERTRAGYLPSNGFRADPNALYYLTGGGNDFLQGRVTSLPQANAAADRLVDSVRTLQGAGARYIMVWLLPDIGLTPAVNGSPLQAFTSQLSAQFNTELVSQLQSVNANVIPLNVPVLLKEAFANPAQFGLATDQNLVGTCFSGNSCTENARYGINSATPDPTKLIYNDAVHPTEAGQRLIADYAYSLLAAPWEATLLPQMAQGTLRSHQDELRNQWLADWENWQAVGQWRAIVAGGGQRQHPAAGKCLAGQAVRAHHAPLRQAGLEPADDRGQRHPHGGRGSHGLGKAVLPPAAFRPQADAPAALAAPACADRGADVRPLCDAAARHGRGVPADP